MLKHKFRMLFEKILRCFCLLLNGLLLVLNGIEAQGRWQRSSGRCVFLYVCTFPLYQSPLLKILHCLTQLIFGAVASEKINFPLAAFNFCTIIEYVPLQHDGAAWRAWAFLRMFPALCLSQMNWTELIKILFMGELVELNTMLIFLPMFASKHINMLCFQNSWQTFSKASFRRSATAVKYFKFMSTFNL